MVTTSEKGTETMSTRAAAVDATLIVLVVVVDLHQREVGVLA